MEIECFAEFRDFMLVTEHVRCFMLNLNLMKIRVRLKTLITKHHRHKHKPCWINSIRITSLWHLFFSGNIGNPYSSIATPLTHLFASTQCLFFQIYPLLQILLIHIFSSRHFIQLHCIHSYTSCQTKCTMTDGLKNWENGITDPHYNDNGIERV